MRKNTRILIMMVLSSVEFIETRRDKASKASKPSKPHIVLLVADDLGWGDVGWNNDLMADVTPNLMRMAETGVTLNQYYVQQVCSPSRAALLTGMYPFHIGRQKGAIKPLQPTGLTLDRTLLPQRLLDMGYRTSMVGKWHLGFCNWKYTPTHRGFQNFIGFYTGAEDHITHIRGTGYDFRQNKTVYTPASNRYTTEILRKQAVKAILSHPAQHPMFLYVPFQAVHAPLEAPPPYIEATPHRNVLAPRQIYRAMVNGLDKAVRDIEEALRRTNMWEDTVLVFTTDNGGAVSQGGSNHPLRGTKGTLFEGGTHGAGFVTGGRVLKSSATSNALMHITDWYPTLLAAAGGGGSTLKVDKVRNNGEKGMDGVNQWDVINGDQESAREEMVYNIKVIPMSGAVRVGDYKLMFANKFNKDKWYNIDGVKQRKCKRKRRPKKYFKGRAKKKCRRGRKMMKDKQFVKKHNGRIIGLAKSKTLFGISSSDEDDEFDEVSRRDREMAEELNPVEIFDKKWPKLKKHLFNVLEDPEEREDLQDKLPDKVEEIRVRTRKLLEGFVKRDYPDRSKKGNPEIFKGIWSPGWCEIEK